MLGISKLGIYVGIRYRSSFVLNFLLALVLDSYIHGKQLMAISIGGRGGVSVFSLVSQYS